MTGEEQIKQLVREHLSGADGAANSTLVKHFANLFDAHGKLYAACVEALSGREIRNPGGFIFSFLRGVENAGGYEAWTRGTADKPRLEPKALDVEKVLRELRGMWATYVKRYTDDELRAAIVATKPMADGDYVFGTRASSLANRLYLAPA